MSELPEGVEPAREAEPSESAAAILVVPADAAGELLVLLGRRSSRSRFMPGQWAFPGGRLETQDQPERPGAHARCASRELAEETGLDLPPGLWLPAGERTTPPLFPVRFHTRFFLGVIPRGTTAAGLIPATAENDSLHLVPPGKLLEDWSRGAAQAPPPVLPILGALCASGGLTADELAARVRSVNAEEERCPRIEFVAGVWVVPLRTATLPPATHTNAWLVGGRRFAIVDPGATDEPELEKLFQTVARRRALGHEPASVLLTHHHRDHAGGASAVARRLGLPILGHPLTLARLAAPECELASLNDGDEIDLDGRILRVLHTPGHAPGHLALDLPGTGALIAGDLVSGVSTILIDHEEGDMEAYLASIERVQRLGERKLLPGHGPPLGSRELGRVVEHRRKREAAIARGLAPTPRPLRDIAREAYAGTPGVLDALAERQTLSHLILLERSGRARRVDPAGREWAEGG